MSWRRPVLFMAVMVCAFAAGCSQSSKKVDRYPKPEFTTRRAVPPRPAPTPPRKFVPAPQPRPDQPEPGWIPPGGLAKRWTDVVIHHSASAAGGAAAFDQHHRFVRKWDELGYHFVIGNGSHTADGRVEVGPRWTKQKHGAHCKTADNHYNEHGVGICLVGNFESTSPSPAQLASLNRLLAFLTNSCNIPVSRIHTHGGVTGKTACPGKRFPFEQVKRQLLYNSRPYSSAGNP